jgi:transposase-like protein
MRTFVTSFIRKVPELDHSERTSVRSALDGVDDEQKVCDLIESRLEENPHCPHCSCSRIYKHGKKSNLQRYKCSNCGKTFNALTGTPLARLRKKHLWLRYMDCMLESTVIRTAGKKLNIDKRTAFLWRHRFSKQLGKDTSPLLQGIVEADETYTRLSYKGCRNLHRAPHKRGGDDAKRGLSKSQVCIVTARDRSTHNVEFIGGLGTVKTAKLDQELAKYIASEAILVTDGLASYNGFCQHNHINHVVVKNKEGERVKGPFHIQHVNSFHQRIKGWLNRHFKGVATKYLHHYLWWMHELENPHIRDATALFRASLC